jgi:hypothetical protein
MPDADERQTHVMLREASTAEEALYECPVDGCGRRLVVNWRRPSLTVLDSGDIWARHIGQSDGLRLSAQVA